MTNNYSGGIVRTDKSAIRTSKSDDGLPINSCEVVIDGEKIRQFLITNKNNSIMKTTKEMIEVMQAHERGEQIEIFMKGKWEYNCRPLWDWVHFDYRVKPKKKYVPFDTAEEFLAAYRKHGEFIENKETGEKMNAYVDKNGIVILSTALNCTYTFESLGTLFGCYKFSDGTPCGKEVNVCQH